MICMTSTRAQLILEKVGKKILAYHSCGICILEMQMLLEYSR